MGEQCRAHNFISHSDAFGASFILLGLVDCTGMGSLEGVVKFTYHFSEGFSKEKC